MGGQITGCVVDYIVAVSEFVADVVLKFVVGVVS